MNNAPALDDLGLFEAVVRLGSFTAAAVELGLAKSTVSTRVSRLEAAVGVRLLQRTTRSLRPTEEGVVFAEHCRRVVEEARGALDALRGAGEEPVGTLRITCPRLFAQAFLQPIVGEYLSLHPRARVQLHLAERPAALVEEGFDLALRIGVPADSSLVVRRLGAAPMVFVASAGYCALHGVPESAEELGEHELITVSRGGAVAWPVVGEAGIRAVPVQGRLQVNSLPFARDLALRGAGVAFLPRFLVAEQLADGEFVEVLEGLAPPPMPVCALYPSRRHLAPRVRAFLDLLVQRTAESPPWR
ncbi:MAG: LysR family transcriptional regulator [Deltaproteobacteria bacterium]|nr:LysR family transcriptional regulator [Deltaproteobacteria bacterium]